VCPRDATPRAEMSAPAGDALIGTVLGRTYRVVRVLGEGGMARLYAAEHLRTEARYAVKVIHDDLSREADLLVRFEREARAAGRIHSDHVVRLVDVLRTNDGRPCLITELLEGEDLQALLDRTKKLSVADAIPIARQLCRAVAAAHAVGVVHRDLKPSNVFLCVRDGAPWVKVLDFGVAKLADDERLTRTDAVMGTAAYMSPEQARRAVDAGPLADVYSIGAVLYHMLAGVPPYGNVPAVSRFALVLHEEPARPRTIEATIPDGVEAVIQHAMARETAARVKTALDLEAELALFDPKISALTTTTAQTDGAHAIDIAVRARFARPAAVVVTVASSLAAGAWIALLLGAIIAPTSGGERALIGLLALITVVGVAMLNIRALRPSWRSAPAVARHTAAPARALFAGLLTLGTLELVSYAATVVLRATPLHAGVRAAVVGLAAAIGLGWRRMGLHDRLFRRIG
jgi:eukaryotic-like serine/threonine-protein kinase